MQCETKVCCKSSTTDVQCSHEWNYDSKSECAACHQQYTPLRKLNFFDSFCPASEVASLPFCTMPSQARNLCKTMKRHSCVALRYTFTNGFSMVSARFRGEFPHNISTVRGCRECPRKPTLLIPYLDVPSLVRKIWASGR